MLSPRHVWLPGSPVLCVGEVLWDALPQGLFLGGAPFNVACHLHQLNVPVLFASRVGCDELGREVLHRIEERGLDSSLVQMDSHLPTGFVRVSLSASGSPTFLIHEPSAWDAIEPHQALTEAARASCAVIYGTLAWRDPRTRSTIEQLLQAAPLAALDVNMRRPYDARETVLQAVRAADFLKLSDGELDTVASWLNLPTDTESRVRALASEMDIPTICVTAGADGAMLLHQGQWLTVAGLPIRVIDAVGAGDAFFASLLAGLLAGVDPQETLARANSLAAYVATQPGATPPLNEQAIRQLQPSLA